MCEGSDFCLRNYRKYSKYMRPCRRCRSKIITLLTSVFCLLVEPWPREINCALEHVSRNDGHRHCPLRRMLLLHDYNIDKHYTKIGGIYEFENFHTKATQPQCWTPSQAVLTIVETYQANRKKRDQFRWGSLGKRAKKRLKKGNLAAGNIDSGRPLSSRGVSNRSGLCIIFCSSRI